MSRSITLLLAAVALAASGCQDLLVEPLQELTPATGHIYIRYGFERGHGESVLTTLSAEQLHTVEMTLEERLNDKVFAGNVIQQWDDGFPVPVDSHGMLTRPAGDIIRQHFRLDGVVVGDEVHCADCEHGFDGSIHCKNCIPLTIHGMDWVERLPIDGVERSVPITAELVVVRPRTRSPRRPPAR